MDIWKHGRYVDLWTLVHFLSGVFLALLFTTLEFTFLLAAFMTLALLMLWEGFEWVLGIIEPSPNVAVDIVIGSLGFLLVAGAHYRFEYVFSPHALYAVLAATLLLALWGFVDFRIKGYR